ncbi:biotin/lipoyl-binding carrier protein [Spongiactinospora sp. TRM90649]|uniref:biotin/lipoyl-binding carrier protein n=1 Tax=Spongiactinospora sp. TRM90649 TaxID=3031114 RepID=UPI0023F6FC91|nr:biotin/lipoyl-binding carrier protein [Spongiactinospora sp. TRM90649]MDF5758295.1 biotin/lipoyl-binding carrier protein [Spongiactinospora sp. TRM90649]
MAEIESDTSAVVWKVLVRAGDVVEEGDAVVILESMKMEIPVESEESGTVTAVHVGEGDAVEEGALLVTLG